MSRTALEKALINCNEILHSFLLMTSSAEQLADQGLNDKSIAEFKTAQSFPQLEEREKSRFLNLWVKWRNQANDNVEIEINTELHDHLQTMRLVIAELLAALKNFTDKTTRDKVSLFLAEIQDENDLLQRYVVNLENSLTEPARQLSLYLEYLETYDTFLGSEDSELMRKCSEFSEKAKSVYSELLKRLAKLQTIIASFNEEQGKKVNVKKFQAWLKGNPNASFDEKTEMKMDLTK